MIAIAIVLAFIGVFAFICYCRAIAFGASFGTYYPEDELND